MNGGPAAKEITPVKPETGRSDAYPASKMFIEMFVHLVALAGRSAGFTGVGARRGVGDEVGVGWTLRALAGARVYVMSGRARHARGARGLAAKGTSLATRGHAIHGVAD